MSMLYNGYECRGKFNTYIVLTNLMNKDVMERMCKEIRYVSNYWLSGTSIVITTTKSINTIGKMLKRARGFTDTDIFIYQINGDNIGDYTGDLDSINSFFDIVYK